MPRGKRSGRRPDYEWQGLAFSLNSIAEANVFQGVAVVNGAATLMRVRGEILASIDAPTDGDQKVLGFGIMIVTDAQLAAGPTSVPSPLTVMDGDWLWHGFIPLVAQAANLEHTVAGRLTIDSKAMRKLKPNDNVVMIVDGLNIAGTPVADATLGVRALFAS